MNHREGSKSGKNQHFFGFTKKQTPEKQKKKKKQKNRMKEAKWRRERVWGLQRKETEEARSPSDAPHC